VGGHIRARRIWCILRGLDTDMGVRICHIEIFIGKVSKFIFDGVSCEFI